MELYRRGTTQILEEKREPLTLCPPYISGQNGSLLYALFTFLTGTMISEFTCEAENVDACQRKPTSTGHLCLSHHFEQVASLSFPSYKSGRTAQKVKQAACIIIGCLSIQSFNSVFFSLCAIVIQFRSYTKVFDKSRSIIYRQSKWAPTDK
jgi:hypothetical protein